MHNPKKPYTVYMHRLPAKISEDKMPKYYIGITCRPVEVRWGDNGDGYKTQPFYRAIKKYGWSSFDHIVVAEDLSFKEASEMEKELIEKYNARIGLRGYNCTDGGEGQVANNEKPVYCIDTGVAYRSSAYASRMTGESSRLIGRRCKEELEGSEVEIKKGYRWCYIDRMNLVHNGGDGNGASVRVVDLWTGELRHSITDMVKIYGGDRRTRVLPLEKYYRYLEQGKSLYSYSLRLRDYLMIFGSAESAK